MGSLASAPSAASAARATSTVVDELRVPIASDVDVVTARQQGRSVAADAGFSSGDQTVIAAAISELARNILMYARRGEIALNVRSEEHTSELQSRLHLVCRLLLEKKKNIQHP